jgi:hypothetical protein
MFRFGQGDAQRDRLLLTIAAGMQPGGLALEALIKRHYETVDGRVDVHPRDLICLAPTKMTTDESMNFYLQLLELLHKTAASDQASNAFYISNSYMVARCFDFITLSGKADMLMFRRALIRHSPFLRSGLFWALPIYSYYPYMHFSLVVVVRPGGHVLFDGAGQPLGRLPPVMYHMDSCSAGSVNRGNVTAMHPTAAICEFLKGELLEQVTLQTVYVEQNNTCRDTQELLMELREQREAISKMTR